MLNTYSYDAFGVEISHDEDDTNPFRYAGQYYDTETGTYYLRARYYDPAIGRFTQQDNWGYADPQDPLSLNLYVYCINNPIKYVDYAGNAWETVLDVMGLAWSILDMIRDPSWANAGFLLWDIASVLVPFLPGSYIRLGLNIFEGAIDALKIPQRTNKALKAFKTVEEAISAGTKLTDASKQFLRREARKFFLKVLESSSKIIDNISNMDIHHIIPLEWAHLMNNGFDPNNIDNLAAVLKDVHHKINGKWTKFRNDYKKLGRSPTIDEIYDQVYKIWEEFGDSFNMLP